MDNQDKNTQDNHKSDKRNDQVDWKNRFNDLVSTCQSELKKTTKIGMKMLSASQSNAQLHETYEAIGRWLKSEVENQRINLDNTEIQDLIGKANQLESELESFENQVQDIKKK